ncbi:MAG: peptidase T [Eubacteriales bacterium]|nr:peptidase T [Eubacteriales bacterium]
MLQYALDYFADYISYDTSSNPHNPACPSNPRIFDLAKKIVADLHELGIAARVDDHAYVYASLPANSQARYKLGLIAHMDTSPDMSGADIKARRIPYTGEAIVLNADHPAYQAGSEDAILLDEKTFPALAELRGQDIVVTDGHSLLGADDKAGIAEIMALAKYLTQHPEIPHGELKIAFTPDEEIGRGADLFDVAAFGADLAFTMDGAKLGEMESENFNAASARITVSGRNVHPGSAKDQMRNALTLAAEFILAMPAREKPEHTEGYEGFYHLTDLVGSVEKAQLDYIIRDFDLNNFQERKQFLQNLVEQFNQKLGEQVFDLEINDSYFNMKEKILPYAFMLDYAREAMEECGITPLEVPIRGGTDGAQLSYKGLPCPNLFVGGDNFHGRYEYLVVDTMAKACEMLVKLVAKFI